MYDCGVEDRTPFTDDPRLAHLAEDFDPIHGHPPLKVFRAVIQDTETGQAVELRKIDASASKVMQQLIDEGRRPLRVEYLYEYDPDALRESMKEQELSWPIALMLIALGAAGVCCGGYIIAQWTMWAAIGGSVIALLSVGFGLLGVRELRRAIRDRRAARAAWPGRPF